MAENVENLIMQHLRDIRDRVGRSGTKLDGVSDEVRALETKIDGLAMMVTMLAGHARRLEERLDQMERG